MPALVDGPVTLYESGVIVEYLEERHPKPALLPADVATRAEVRIEELEATLYFGDAFRAVARERFFTPPDRRDPATLETALAAVRAQVDQLEARATGRGGEFVVGDALTRADLAWLPFIEIMGRAGENLDPARTPWLDAWCARMRTRPTYERSYPPHWRR